MNNNIYINSITDQFNPKLIYDKNRNYNLPYVYYCIYRNAVSSYASWRNWLTNEITSRDVRDDNAAINDFTRISRFIAKVHVTHGDVPILSRGHSSTVIRPSEIL